ncbi:MAG: hypothetical protein QXD70_03450 [Candidatus Bathyarchaeia archaeon]
MPLPASTFLGTFTHPKVDVDGTIKFTIANSGNEITSLQVEKLVCKLVYSQGNVYAQFTSLSFPEPIPELTLKYLTPTEIANINNTIPITDGQFRLSAGSMTIEGGFISQTQARGKIKLESIGGCDGNVITWNAEIP